MQHETVKSIAKASQSVGREVMSEAIRPEPAALPFRLCKFARILVLNGWGQRIPATVTTEIHSETKEFGTKVFAFQARGPWQWFAVASRDLTWWPA